MDPRRDRSSAPASVFLDGTIVNVALKRSGEDLPATAVGVLEGQTYVVSGYLAVLAALLILAGALSDHYGRRRIYAIGLVGFAGDLGAVRPRADARVAGPLPPPPGRRRRAARARVARRSSPTPSRARRAAARSGSGRPRPRR